MVYLHQVVSNTIFIFITYGYGMPGSKAAFFDRDGTLIEDVGYLSSPNDIKIMPHMIEFCRLLQREGYSLFIVTNQSGIARGFFDEDALKRIHACLDLLLQSHQVYFEKYYYCPHHPTQAVVSAYLETCSCRKPQPGMLEQAAREFELNLEESLMFGDKKSDIEAGTAARCRSFYVADIDFATIIKNQDLSYLHKREKGQ